MEKETDQDTDETTVTYTRVTVLDGIVLGVTAHIKDDDTITMNVVPVFFLMLSLLKLSMMQQV